MQNLKMCMDGNLVSHTNGRMWQRCQGLTVWLKEENELGDCKELENEELRGL